MRPQVERLTISLVVGTLKVFSTLFVDILFFLKSELTSKSQESTDILIFLSRTKFLTFDSYNKKLFIYKFDFQFFEPIDLSEIF